MREVQGEERNERPEAGQDEEWPLSHERALPNVRDRTLPHYELLKLSSLHRYNKAKALSLARAALEKQAEDLVVMDVRFLSSVADFFIICTAASARQINALKEHIEASVVQSGSKVWHTEGSAEAAAESDSLQWLLMDCGDVIVHLFNQRAREFYRLEDLWADAPRVPL